MKHETAIKNELEMLSDSDKERFERIRVAQIEKYGSEKPEQLQSALHTIRRVSYQRLESESLKEGNFAQLRSARLSMALLMEEEVEQDDELLRKTLATHLDLCYIDLNGPQNSTTREREPVSYTHLRAHETPEHLVCRLLLEKKKKKTQKKKNKPISTLSKKIPKQKTAKH